MAYPSPGAVGPPVDFNRPPGSHEDFTHVLVHALTRPGNSVTSSGDWLHALMHPRAALAAGMQSPIGQAAALFVPGPGRSGRFSGKLTETQRSYMEQLNNVKGGTIDRRGGYGGDPGYRTEYHIEDPEFKPFSYGQMQQVLAERIRGGAAKQVADMHNVFGFGQGRSPLVFRGGGTTNLGSRLGVGRSLDYGASAPEGRFLMAHTRSLDPTDAARMNWLYNLLQNQAKFRRN